MSAGRWSGAVSGWIGRPARRDLGQALAPPGPAPSPVSDAAALGVSSDAPALASPAPGSPFLAGRGGFPRFRPNQLLPPRLIAMLLTGHLALGTFSRVFLPVKWVHGYINFAGIL